MVQKAWNGSNDDWATADDWTPTGEPGPGDDAVVDGGAAQIQADVGSVSTVTNAATLSLEGAGALATTDDLTNTGTLSLDYGDTQGGARLTVGGTLDNSGGFSSLVIGNGDLSATANVTAGALANAGAITIQGSANQQATLDVLGAAGTGTAGHLTGNFKLSGEALLEFGSGGITSNDGNLALFGAKARVAVVSDPTTNSALTGLATNPGSLDVEDDASIAITGDLSNTGNLSVDFIDTTGGAGFSVAGQLTNSGQLSVGSGDLGLSDGGKTAVVSLGSLDNTVGNATGSISVLGNVNGGVGESLEIGGAAGFGTAGVLTGNVSIGDNADIAFASGQIASIAVGSTLALTGPTARVVSGAAKDNALAGLAAVAGTLSIRDDASVTTTGDLTNTGNISLDYSYTSGGGRLSVGGKLTNSATLLIGNGGLSTTAEVSAASLDNTVGATTGQIDIVGNGDGSAQAILDVAGAAGALTGQFSLQNDALLEFGSGQVTSIATGSTLTLSGPKTFVADAGSTTSNSALEGLASVVGTLSIDGGDVVTTTGDLDVSGYLGLDDGEFTGGSSLAVGGTLTDEGHVQIGFGPGDGFLGLTAPDEASASALDDTTAGVLNIVGQANELATLDVAGPADFGAGAGVLVGQIGLYNDALLEFGSGEVTSIAAGSSLDLQGTDVRVADAGATGTNSALTGLASIAGTFGLNDGATLTTTGDLTVTSTGTLGVDTAEDAGGSTLTVGGTLVDDGTVGIGFGPGDIFLGIESSDLVSADAVDVATGATLSLVGYDQSNGTDSQAVLKIAGAAGFGMQGVLTGTVSLYNDALLQFASGQITTIASGSSLKLDGSKAYVADAGATTSDSALTGLSEVAGGFYLNYGATLTTSGDVTVGTAGTLQLDTDFGGGGTDLTIGGTLHNEGSVYIGFGPGDSFLGITSSDSLNVQALDNQAGAKIQLAGAGTVGVDATLVVAGAAGFGQLGVLSGEVDLYYDARLSFGSGSITSVASSGILLLNGADAQIVDAGTSGSDTALSGLASNAGSISLENGQVASTTGDFANSGSFGLDDSGQGSSFTVGGTFSNSGTVNVGNGGIGVQTQLRVLGLDNEAAGQFGISGSGTAEADVEDQGALTNAGTLTLSQNVQARAGSLDNSGTMTLSGPASDPSGLEVFGTAANSNLLDVAGAAGLDVAGTFTDSGELEVGGTVDAGSGLAITTTGSLVMQGGQVVAPTGEAVSVASGGTVSGYGAIAAALVNDGTITAQGGTLTLADAVTGTGSLAIGQAAELDVGTTSQSVDFGGHVGTLKLDAPAAFDGAIAGLVQGDTLDLAGVVADGASVSGSTLTVTAGTQTYRYQVSGVPAGSDFSLEDDGQGGTDVVLGTPGVSVRAPKAQTVFTGYPAVLGPVSVADPVAALADTALSAVVSDTSGSLSATAAAGGSVTQSDANHLTLTGTLDELNAELASLLYAGVGGSDTVDIQVTDAEQRTASQQIAVTTLTVGQVMPVLNLPPNFTIDPTRSSGLNGLSVSAPSSAPLDQQIQLTVQAPLGTFVASGGPGGTVSGQGTNTVAITGTLAQVNSYLSDGLEEEFDLEGIEAAEEDALAAEAKPEFDVLDLYNGKNLPKPGNLGTDLFIDYAAPANEIELELEGGLSFPPIPGYGVHLGTADGLVYNFDAAGEFILALSTQPSDTFQVQIRLQPLAGSDLASVLTQVGAAIGNDDVTFGVGRNVTAWVDGAPSTVSIGHPATLAAGQLSQLSANTYRLDWNTGESITVTNNGAYLDIQTSLGSNRSIVGLIGSPDGNSANDFALPGGTVLPQPLTSDELYKVFGNAWRVPSDQFSLLDYGPGQSTTTFTDTTFPAAMPSLSDFPATLVAQAEAAVAAAGITDPVSAASAEYDYIVSGGNTTIVANDASLLQGAVLTAAPITPSGAAPALVGVDAPASTIVAAQNGDTDVTFDVYLTQAVSTSTDVHYQVVSPDPDDFSAQDFSGGLPSGDVTIASGETAGQIVISLPQTALGSSAAKNVVVQISAPNGPPVIAATATETVAAPPTAGPPSTPTITSLTNIGTFTHVGNNYVLDLGQVGANQPLPDLEFGVVNASDAPADDLAGTFDVADVAGFSVSGAQLPAAIAAGQSYDGLDVTLSTGADPTQEIKFGSNSDTITFDPVDTNATGYAFNLLPVTLTVTYDLVPQNMVYSEAWGDVHIITYNGLHYDFQAVGEFTLAKSRVQGDSFDIQLRLAPWTPGAQVTTIHQVAISLGTADVTFDWSRTDPVTLNGSAATIDQANPVLTLDGGTVTELTPNEYEAKWNTGEVAWITNEGSYINVQDGVPVGQPGFIGGLQGEDEGTANDFQLPDGTVLKQPLTSAQLYGQYADGWRVTDATSLFDYAPGQSTATFTDKGFPATPLSLQDFTPALVAQAQTVVAAAGIADPVTAANAELDYLATGEDPDFITGAENVAQAGFQTTQADVTPSTAPSASLTVSAPQAKIIENAGDVTPVTFDVSLNMAVSSDTVVDYSVVSAGAGYLDATAFDGMPSSGQITIAEGQTSGVVTLDLPQNVLGGSPAENLRLQISSPSGPDIVVPTAQTEIVNNQATSVSPAQAQLLEIGSLGTFSQSGDTYTLDLGTVTQASLVQPLRFGILNNASVGADSLAGQFSVPSGGGFGITGTSLATPIVAGQTYQGLYVSAQANTVGTHSETLVFTPQDVNDTGYAQTLSPLTLTITDTVVPPAQAQLNTPGTIIFPNVRVGSTADQQAVSITNTAAMGAESLDVSATANAEASVSGGITGLAPGATDATSLKVGLDTSQAGPASGAVTIVSDSDDGAGGTTPLEAPDTFVDVFGAAYRPATPTVTLSTSASVVHVGDPGTASLTVANIDPADGYSENLVATLAGVTGNVTSQGKATTGEIAAGTSDSSSFKLGFSTAQAGVVSGDAIVGLTSDGGTGSGSIDGLGTLTLPNDTVPLSITVDNYAEAGLAETSGGGTFAATANGYTLDLGTIAEGSGPVTVDLAALNTAMGPADLLAGTFGGTVEAGFTNALSDVLGIGADGSAAAGTVTLSTTAQGLFQETVTFSSTGANASGYSAALPTKTLVITGTVADETSPYVTVSSSETAINASSPPATITFAFSKPLNAAGFVAGDVTTTGGTLGAITQSQTNPDDYTATFTPTAGFAGEGSVTVAAGSYTDTDGNAGSAGGTAIAEDLVPPSVGVTSDETSLDAASAPATISFAFSKPIAGFVAGDVTTTGGTLGAITQSQTNPELYTAAFTPTAGFTGEGSVSVAAGSYTDLAGNPGSAGATSLEEDLPVPTVTITTPGGTVGDPSQVVMGTGEAGTTLSLFDNGASVPVATTQIGSDGQWSLGLTLSTGDNTIVATDTDSGGNTGTSNTIDLVLAEAPAGGSPGTGPSGVGTPPGSGATGVATPPAGSGSGPGVPTAQGAGSEPPPQITFDPNVDFISPTVAILSGTVSDATGTASVEVYADNGLQDLGAATVGSDGTWTFQDDIGPHTQNFLSATATDSAGGAGTADAHYTLTAGVTPAERPAGQPYTSIQDNFSTSDSFVGENFFGPKGQLLFNNVFSAKPGGILSYTYPGGAFFDNKDYYEFTDDYSPSGVLRKHVEDDNDGSHRVTGYADGVLFESRRDDTFTAFGKSDLFAFTRGFGQDVITSFTLDGPDHDTIVLPKFDASLPPGTLFGTATTDAAGDAVLHLDPHDQITIKGVGVADLEQHKSDFRYQA